jgi:cytidine deaminase
MVRPGHPPNAEDRALIETARDALRRGYDRKRHTVGAAVRTRTGAVYVGLNIEGIHTPCAEPVAIGAALTAGDREIVSMVAVCRRGREYLVLSPCGNCRQMLYDYAPRATTFVRFGDGKVVRLTAAESLPGAFRTLAPD